MRFTAALLTPLLVAATHYGDPNKFPGCAADEEKIQITGLAGDFCSPACNATTQACPTDVPTGVTAKPSCALSSSSGGKYCALVCSPTTDEASLRAGDAQCGAKASCKAIQGSGLCTYDDIPVPPSSEHWEPVQSPTFAEQSVVIAVAFEKTGQVGFAGAGQNGVGATIIRTQDAGKTWDVVFPKNASKPGVNLFLGSAAKSAENAVVTGILNQEFTIDGKTFEPALDLFLSPSQDANVMPGGNFALTGSFRQENGVAISSDFGVSYKAYDMGVNKTIFPARYAAYPSDTTWYVTAGVFPSNNAKATELTHRISVDENPMQYRVNTAEINFADPVNCSVDASNCYSASIQKTTDGGKTFTTVFQNTNDNIYPNGIHCTSEEHCVAVLEGETCRIIVTRDGGKTWNETMHDTDTASSLMAVHMIDENEAWVAGGHLATLDFEGRYWHTLDGGKTWAKEKIMGLYILSFDMQSAQSGYSVGLTAASGVQLIKYKGSNHTVAKKAYSTIQASLAPEFLGMAANGTHYGDPKQGCQSDEQAVQITGVTGDFCTPACDSSGSCPTDVPTGVTAKPTCALQTPTGAKYCALICSPSKSDDAQCGTNASCKAISGVGICTYDD